MDAPVNTRIGDLDTLRAARQAGILFLVSAALSVVAISGVPDRRDQLLLLAATDVAIALVTFMLPWRRWPVRSTLALAVAAWTVIGGSTWAIGGVGSGSGAFFVLAFAWMGLHHNRRTILLNAPVAAAAYVVGLVLNADTRLLLTGAVLVIPFAVTVGLIIEGRVRRLTAARAVIEEEQRWRTALMATLAHDVRSPLTTIHGVLEIIAESADLPSDLQPLVASAARQTSRLTTLASTLLDLERVEGGKLVLDWQDVDLEDLAHEVAELLDSPDMSVQVEPDLTVRADRMRLQQMMINLGTNAQQHGHPPFIIGARSQSAVIEVFVRDHGEGLLVADVPLLFERLGRTDGSPESVGLGLWIVRLLARAHGGDAVHRPADPGSEFVIKLPKHASPAESHLPHNDVALAPARATPL